MPAKRRSPRRETSSAKRARALKLVRARAKPVHGKPRPPARRRRKSTDALDRLIDGMAAVLALPIAPAWRPAVKANLQVALQLAATFADLPLPDEAEPAPVFRA